MQIKFFNTDIHIQHVKIGTVVSYTHEYYGLQYGHIVGFGEMRGQDLLFWVQFGQDLDDSDMPFTKTRINSSVLELVGH